MKQNMIPDNNWISNNLEQIEYYLNSQSEILVERKRCIDILLRLFSYQFSQRTNLKIFDIGCGDGILSQIINDRFPGNKFTLIDGSHEMLSKAKERLKEDNFEFQETTFEKIIDEPIIENRMNFTFSSMAIHHLPFSQKESLFAKIYHELCIDGLFLNIDVVLPETVKSEEWQFNLWRDWIIEKQDSKSPHELKHTDLPKIYKNKSENKPSILFDQLSGLKKIGFRNVECFYKYGIFTLFGGTKQ
jgi:tRNA (cmo5U34)-methyltransferase